MITPILRLLAIYCIVGLAVFGLFKRDAIMGMFASNDAPDEIVAAPVATIMPASVPALTPATAEAEAVVFAPLPDGGDVATLEPTKPDYEAELNNARAAYWANERPTAIARYGALLAQYPNDEAANGELGNIYFMNGQRDLAATHFEKAGLAAIKDGHRATVQMLIGVLRSINPGAATRLINAGASQ